MSSEHKMRVVEPDELKDDVNRNLKRVMEILYSVHAHVTTHKESGEEMNLQTLLDEVHEARFTLRDAYMDLNKGTMLATESKDIPVT